MEKVCRRCGVEKNEKKFKTDKRQPDGRTVTCRECYTYNQLEERNLDPIQIENCKKAVSGRKHSLEWRLAISRGQKKAVLDGRHHWKKNETPHKDSERTHIEYKIWRERLLERSSNKCQDCGNSNRLHAHHLKCFYKFPELRYDLENGKILCQSCHSKLHKIRDKTGKKKKIENPISMSI